MSPLFDQDADEYVDLPAEGRTGHKAAMGLAILVGVLLIGGLLVRNWWTGQIDPAGEPGEAVSVEIPRGTTITGAGTLLADKGVIGNATVFRVWVRGKDIEVQAGDYTFQQNSSFDEAVEVIEAGPRPEQAPRLTVPEGLTLAQMTDRITEQTSQFSADDIRAALADPANRSSFQPDGQASLEGMLFPSTYDVSAKDTAATLVKRMIAQMEAVAGQQGIAAGPQGSDDIPPVTPYQVLTVASLVQAEAGSPEEMPRIARVIYNRLLRGEPLGIDATSRYESQQTGRPIDFDSDSPYNTRRRDGLPPTPIAGPGEAAIAAALHPADGPWLYYVLEEKGRHFFTDDYDEFTAKKAECEQKGLGCG